MLLAAGHRLRMFVHIPGRYFRVAILFPKRNQSSWRLNSSSIGGKGPVKPKLSKAQTSADVAAYGERVAETKAPAMKDAITAGSAIIVKLNSNPALLKSIKQKILVGQ